MNCTEMVLFSHLFLLEPLEIKNQPVSVLLEVTPVIIHIRAAESHDEYHT